MTEEYKLVTSEQYEQLKTTDIKFAAFYKKDSEKYNIVFLNSEAEMIKQQTESKPKQTEKKL